MAITSLGLSNRHAGNWKVHLTNHIQMDTSSKSGVSHDLNQQNLP